MHKDSALLYGHAMPAKTRLGLSAAITAAMLLPAFFFFSGKEAPPAMLHKPSTVHRIYVLPSMESDPEMQKALDNIHAWIDLKSPDKVDNPESSVGFNEFIASRPSFPCDSSAATVLFPRAEPSAWSSRQSSPTPEILGDGVKAPPRPYNSVLPWKQFWFIELPQAEPLAMPSGIIWRDANGRRIANAPEIEAGKIAGPWNKNRPSGVTTLECSLVSGRMPPRVIVRTSCGNPELDMLAADALRRHLLAGSARAALANRKFKNFTADVIWQLQQNDKR